MMYQLHSLPTLDGQYDQSIQFLDSPELAVLALPVLVAVGLVTAVPAVVVAVANPELRHTELVVTLVLGAGAVLADIKHKSSMNVIKTNHC